MQIKSGLAMIQSGDHRRVQFSGITAEDVALLAAGQLFKFQGEAQLWYTIETVVSAVQPIVVALTAAYEANRRHDDVFAPYLIAKDFTSVNKFMESAIGDADPADADTYNWRLADPLIRVDGGNSGSGSGFSDSGISDVTAGSFSKTITPSSGSFPTPPFGIFALANWPTGIGWSNQTTGQVVLTFIGGAPTGAKVIWGVWKL